MLRHSASLCLVASFMLVGCGSSATDQQPAKPATATSPRPLDGYVTVDRLPMPTEAHLVAGRATWADTCHACHGLGEAGSPKITDAAAWAPRIAKGTDVLHRHAVQGFIGPSGTMMPALGGNPRLTETQVIAAVDYMVANSR